MEFAAHPRSPHPLYSPDQQRRRDESKWTLVQGILAPLQFLVFLVSLALVIGYLATGDGYLAATVSVLAKTGVLYLIMITGCLWEKDVYGCYLFAKPFFWEDVVSMAVIALHTLYLASVIGGFLDARSQMLVALAAYATYLVNAGQFLIKFRTARRSRLTDTAGSDLAMQK